MPRKAKSIEIQSTFIVTNAWERNGVYLLEKEKLEWLVVQLRK